MTKKIDELKREIEEAKQDRKRLLSHLRTLELQLSKYKREEDSKKMEKLRQQINDSAQ